jgi:hypothetical protein
MHSGCDENCVEEEGGLPLRLSSIWCCSCVRDEVDSGYCFIIITLWVWLKLRGYRRQSVAGDINESAWLGRLCARRRRMSLKPVFYYVLQNCVRVSVDVALVILTCAVLTGCGRVWAVVVEHAGAVCLCGC